MKKLASIFLTLVLTATPVFAVQKQTTTSIHFNGNTTQVSSIVKNNTTYLGVRELSTATGLDVSYLPGNKSVTIKKGTDTLELLPQTAIYYFNLEDPGEVDGLIQDDKVYVPLRFIFEKFGMNVSYTNNAVYISEKTASSNSSHLTNIANTLSDQTRLQITDLICPISLALDELDMQNYNDYDLFLLAHKNSFSGRVSFGVDHRTADTKYINDWCYIAYPIEPVDNYIYNLVGIKPNVNTSVGDDLNYYKEGNYYYFPDWAKGGALEIVGSDIKQMFDLGNNYYALHFYEYNTYTHGDDPTFPTTTDSRKWSPMQYETWCKSQAILKKTVENNKAKWTLVKYEKNKEPFTTQELNHYKQSYQ